MNDTSPRRPLVAAINDAATPTASPTPPVLEAPATASDPPPSSQLSQDLRSKLCVTIAPPILWGKPALRAPRRRRAADEVTSPPRRSVRQAAKSSSRASNPIVQAQNVLRAKLGEKPGQPTSARGGGLDFDDYLTMFDEPLSGSKREAIMKLFPVGCSINGVQLAEGVEAEV